MKIIAISGWKGSGKDTAAHHLAMQHGYVHLSFAEALKEMVGKQYKVPVEHCSAQSHKEKPLPQYPLSPKDGFSLYMARMLYAECRDIDGNKPLDYHEDPSGAFLGVMGRHTAQLYWTPRALCILEGNIKRSVNSNYWVDKVAVEILDEVGRKGPTYFVVSDLRYKSEANILRQRFGDKLLTVRVNRFEKPGSTESSENDLNDYKFDTIIDNTSTLEALFEEVDKVA